MAPTLLTVVIPARNAADTLGAQLDALVASKIDGMQVVLVDNGSTDGTEELALRWANRMDLRVIRASRRANVGYARNAGIAAARSDSVVICDADDEVRPSWARAMAGALVQHRYVTGPLLVDRLNDLRSVELRGPRQFSDPPTLFGQVPYATGCNVGLRRELVDEIGWFREDLIAGEDVEFGVRAWEHGAGCAFALDAAIDYRLRSEPRAVWRQATQYGTFRPFIRRRCADIVDRAGERRAIGRRVGWLARHAPQLVRREQRASWLWVAGLQVGELRGLAQLPRVPLDYDNSTVVGPHDGRQQG